ncbi:MAG: lamin tail domain-containing protein [Planctomycetes bacterium]|nr:lamin tail domain-containing protein [Planctomycetota bacterium]
MKIPSQPAFHSLFTIGAQLLAVGAVQAATPNHEASELVPNSIVAAAPWAPPALRINEVGIGDVEYVELFNGGASALSLSGCRITTSLGSVSLSNVTQLIPSGGYYVVARMRPADVGVSNDPTVPLKVVSAPMTGILADTVVLETAGGAVIDAMAYGTAAPTGPLYAKAVAAGQFPSGQFVNIGAEYGSLALGRNSQGKDNNNLASDWQPHGGAQAYCGSPMKANTAIPVGATETVKMIQARLNQVLLNIYGCDVTSAGHSGYTGNDANSNAVHSLKVQSPIHGALVLTGNLSHTFAGSASGGYTIKTTGTLKDAAAGVQLDVNVNDKRSGTTQTVTVTVNLKDLAGAMTQRPYTETVVLAGSGTRGNHAFQQTRSLTDWSGITRSTTASSNVQWTMANGILGSVLTNANIQRDFPIVPNIQTGSPNPPFTTERLTFSSTGTRRGDGFDIKYDSWVSDFGAYGQADHQGARMSVTVDDSGQNFQAERVANVTFPSPSGIHTAINVQSSMAVDRATGNIAIESKLFNGAVLLGTATGFIDPAPVVSTVQGGFWSSLGSGLWTATKWVGHIGATVVVGGACALGTVVVTGAAGIVDVATLGAATPGSVTAVVVTGGGCVYLSNLTYSATTPGG